MTVVGCVVHRVMHRAPERVMSEWTASAADGVTDGVTVLPYTFTRSDDEQPRRATPRAGQRGKHAMDVDVELLSRSRKHSWNSRCAGTVQVL